MSEVISRREAIDQGLSRYFTGKACPRGHVEERRVGSRGCVICEREGSARYRESHGEQCKSYSKVYMRDWQKANRERCRAHNRASYEAHKDQRRVSIKAWARANPEKVKSNRHNRRALKRSAEGSHTAQDIQNIYGTQHGLCAYCKVEVGTNYHVDHIQPLSRGGSNGKENLQITCPSCNMRKHTKTHEEFLRELELQEHSELELEPLPLPLPYQPQV